jgi:sterol 3beta-glucosyltransferase
MDIVITTYGVRGDVQPYVALAVALQAAGHRVTLATSSDFSGWIEGYGVGTHPTPFNMQALMQQPETQAVLRSKNEVPQMRMFRETMRQEDGVARAVELIEQHAAAFRGRRHPLSPVPSP